MYESAMTHEIIIAPSIRSADFAKLGEEGVVIALDHADILKGLDVCFVQP